MGMGTKHSEFAISDEKDQLLNGWRGTGCPNQKVLIEDQRNSEELKEMLEEMKEIRKEI